MWWLRSGKAASLYKSFLRRTCAWYMSPGILKKSSRPPSVLHSRVPNLQLSLHQTQQRSQMHRFVYFEFSFDSMLSKIGRKESMVWRMPIITPKRIS